MRALSVLPAASFAVNSAPLSPGARTSWILQCPSSDTSASYGPAATSAPGSVVPLNVMIRSVTVAPSSGEVMRSEGGVVSRGSVVAGAEVVEGASVDVVASVVDGSVDVDVSVDVVVELSLSAERLSSSAVAWVVAVRLSASDMRSASTADATRADACGSVESATSIVSVSSGSVFAEGENAAKPITATRAMMRRPAYASGIRGLTWLR